MPGDQHVNWLCRTVSGQRGDGRTLSEEIRRCLSDERRCVVYFKGEGMRLLTDARFKRHETKASEDNVEEVFPQTGDSKLR